jgi:two-component system alkaline phosphatase synthesis response regulator PhoP
MGLKRLIYSLEDDEDISAIINVSLTKAGYEIVSFAKPSDFFLAFEKQKPELVLLDLMLPEEDGMSVLKKIREDKANEDLQIIIISAKRMTMDKVEGLDLGADDYIEKPFNILELISRVNARLRRNGGQQCLAYKDLSLDEEGRVCSYAGARIELTNMEFNILLCLLKHQGKLVNRDELIVFLYGPNVALETRAIDMHVASLRRKLGPGGDLIKTVYGFGYQLG